MRSSLRIPIRPTIRSALQLVDEGTPVASYANLHGPALALLPAVLDLWSLRTKPISPSIFFAFADALRVQLPLSWTASSIDVFAQMYPLGTNWAPSPFLPFIFELEGWLRSPGHFTSISVARMRAYTPALAASAARNSGVVVAAAGILAQCVQLCVRTSSLGDAHAILKAATDALRPYKQGSAEYLSAYPDIIDAEYEIHCSNLELIDSTDRKSRSLAAESTLKLLDRMEDALRQRNGVFRRSRSAQVMAEIRRSGIVARHRRLLWLESLAREGDAPAHERSFEWRQITRQYLKICDRLNATAAAANAVDCALDALERGRLRPRQIRDALRTLITPLERLCSVNLRRFFPSEQVVLSMKSLIRAHLASGASKAVDLWLGAAAMSLRALLHECDAYRRSYVLRDADDWLGLAVRADRLRGGYPSHAVDIMYEIVRGRSYTRPTFLSSEVHIRAMLSRHGSLFEVRAPYSERRWIASGTHEVAVALDAAFRRGMHESMTALGKKAPAPTLAWDQIQRRLVGHLRLEVVRSTLIRGGCLNDRRILVETDGHGVHVHWLSALQHARVPIESLLVHAIDNRQGSIAAPSGGPPIVLDAFPARDVGLKNFMAGVARTLGTTQQTVLDPASLVAGLRAVTPLIVLGCHGGRDSARGSLSLELSGRNENAAEIIRDLAIHGVAPTVIAFVCFAGDGFSEAGGEWQSLPQLLLKAGARAVVASMTPAWCTHDRELFCMIREVYAGASAGDMWGIGAAVVSLCARLRSMGADACHWVGWSTWV